MNATQPVPAVAPPGESSPPAPSPAACAPIPLGVFLKEMGLELLEGGEDLDVVGFTTAGLDGKPDMSKAVML